jgi:hypothetical protein
MSLRKACLVGLVLLIAGPAFAKSQKERRLERKEAAEHRSAGHKVLFYLPNRFLDVFDIVRFRARVGPGVAVSVRATEYADAYVGLYAAGYVGLPGPRNRRIPKLPFGIESKNGVELSKADLSTGFWIFDPDYGETEFGLGAQVLLVGGDVGFDPGELIDFLGGLVFLDPKVDDL